MLKKTILTACVLVSWGAWGSFSEVGEFAEAEISRVQSSLDQGAPFEGEGSQWYFRRFLLRLRKKIGFEVPFLGGVKVVPELELYWQRDLPPGQKIYRP